MGINPWGIAVPVQEGQTVAVWRLVSNIDDTLDPVGWEFTSDRSKAVGFTERSTAEAFAEMLRAEGLLGAPMSGEVLPGLCYDKAVAVDLTTVED